MRDDEGYPMLVLLYRQVEIDAEGLDVIKRMYTRQFLV